ncbi:FkbM family methyltransferase [Nostoc sp. MG11]|uniref:FkbM family methyltransferase n=1 Tax=Nostoc sp. MG11 TaxID=2721166 RepID=UPI0018696B35|nr:FkbM family methyltransferase [Nostoc sp. MG11]
MSFFVPVLKESGKLDEVHITVCVVGSRKISIDDDYCSGGWLKLAPNLTIYGFDADPDACEQANKDLTARQINWKEKHIPIALNNSIGSYPLYVTNQIACTSLYPPNSSYLTRFQQIISDSFKVDCTVEIETTTLDNYCEQQGIEEIDFLQVDVQGADLHILEGASLLLQRSVLAIQTEVEFSHLYINQPLFSDIDTFLRKNSFTLFDLVGCSRYPRACSPICSPERSGQLLWADAFYFRDLIRADITMQLKTPLQILKLACIADILGFPDYALELLEYLTINHADEPKYNFADVIIRSLSQVPELVERGLDFLPIIANIRHRLN